MTGVLFLICHVFSTMLYHVEIECAIKVVVNIVMFHLRISLMETLGFSCASVLLSIV